MKVIWPYSSGEVIVQNFNAVLSLAHLTKVVALKHFNGTVAVAAFFLLFFLIERYLSHQGEFFLSFFLSFSH
jgi:hypothetical protein